MSGNQADPIDRAEISTRSCSTVFFNTIQKVSVLFLPSIIFLFFNLPRFVVELCVFLLRHRINVFKELTTGFFSQTVIIVLLELGIHISEFSQLQCFQSVKGHARHVLWSLVQRQGHSTEID